MRGAYVEFNLVHGEIQPTFWWIAQQLDESLAASAAAFGAWLERVT